MGEILELNTKDMISQEKNVFFASHNLHSDKIGKLDRIQFDSNLEKKIIEKKIYKSKGNDIEYFNDASKTLGTIIMKFESKEEMKKTLDNINELYRIVLK